jgi:pimeloyl-ACP methyl ester carboxylesterase
LPERKLTADGSAEVETLLRAWSAAREWLDPETVSRYRRAMQIEAVAHCSLEYHRWAVRSLFRPDGMRFARRMQTPIARPVLHLHGARDPVILPSTAAGSGQYVAGPYSWCTVSGAGHFPHEERADVVTDALLRWLAA